MTAQSTHDREHVTPWMQNEDEVKRDYLSRLLIHPLQTSVLMFQPILRGLRTLLSKKDEKPLEINNFIDNTCLVENMEEDNKKQSALWTNRFGDDYIRRNTITDTDLNIRMGMWQAILSSYGFVGGDHLKAPLRLDAVKALISWL